jgi:hypothetical protein
MRRPAACCPSGRPPRGREGFGSALAVSHNGRYLAVTTAGDAGVQVR